MRRVIVLLTLALAACGAGDPPIVGRWNCDQQERGGARTPIRDTSLAFFRDGTYEAAVGPNRTRGTYTIPADGRYTVRIADATDPAAIGRTAEGRYTIDGDALSVTVGETTTRCHRATP